MNLPNLSTSSMAMLLTTLGLSSSSLLPSSSTQTVEPDHLAQSIEITDSVTEVRGHNGVSVRIINRHDSRQAERQQSPSLRSDRLSEPYRLTVETSGRSLNATLKVNGTTIQTLTSLSETVNLSPYLSAAGQHKIEIVGYYSPATATAQIVLTGPGTQLSQQVSGRGTLDQTWQVLVR